jgi:hypothetical protein
MSTKASVLIVTTLLVASFLALPPQAHAQPASSPVAGPELASPPPPRYARRRIEIHPERLLYRRCVDWYELQNRPSGTVLFPQMRCWWVRG